MSEIKGRRQTRSAGLQAIRSLPGEGNERRFELSFSSESPIEMWFGTEVLDHTDDAVDLTRLNEMGCVLFNHDRNCVVAKVLRAWIEDGRGKAEIEFDSDEQADVIYQKVQGGTLRGVSVSYDVGVYEDVKNGEASTDGRFQGPCSIARKWVPYEISIVSVPADASVGVGRAKDIDNHGQINRFARQIQINQNKGGKK